MIKKHFKQRLLRIDCCGYLVTNYGEGGGGLQNGRGEREVLPLRKGGVGKSFSHAEGGAQKVLGSFLRSSLKF